MYKFQFKGDYFLANKQININTLIKFDCNESRLKI